MTPSFRPRLVSLMIERLKERLVPSPAQDLIQLTALRNDPAFAGIDGAGANGASDVGIPNSKTISSRSMTPFVASKVPPHSLKVSTPTVTVRTSRALRPRRTRRSERRPVRISSAFAHSSRRAKQLRPAIPSRTHCSGCFAISQNSTSKS